MKYHLLDNKTGFFFLLRQAGLVDDLLDAEEVLDAMQFPPPQTRAWLRGSLIRRYPHYILSANWDVLRFHDSGKNDIRNLWLSMNDPTDYSQKQTETILNNSNNFEEILTRLQQINFKEAANGIFQKTTSGKKKNTKA